MLKIKTRQDKTARILIVIAVILAFGLIGCSNGGGGSSGSSSSSSGWKAVDGPITTGTRSENGSSYTVSGLDLYDVPFTLTKNTSGGNDGVWTGLYDGTYQMRVTVSGNSWESEIDFGYGFEKTAKGTFTFSGSSFTLKVTHLFE